MNKLLQENGILVLTANPQYKHYIYQLELKVNYTFRLIKGDYENIYYDSYGNFSIDELNNMLVLEFTELEKDFHNLHKINVKQNLKYEIINEEKKHNKNNLMSFYTIIFDKCPSPYLQDIKIINNENIFYNTY
jgi:hypothetical protein